MNLNKYKNASDIPTKLLKNLVKSEIECWWSSPFDEFMRCSDQKCWTIYSIEDVYWSIENYRNRTFDKEFYCDCWTRTEQFYKPWEFYTLVKEYIKWQVSAILLLDNEEVEWFGIISKTTLWNLINLEFATRPWSYDKKDLLKNLSQEIFWIENANNKEVIVLHHIFVSEIFRWKGFWKEILKSMLNLSSNWIPILLETRFDSSFYAISRSLWFQNLVTDKYWYVVQFNINDLNSILELFLNLWNEFNFYKSEALKILENNPKFLLKKSYI